MTCQHVLFEKTDNPLSPPWEYQPEIVAFQPIVDTLEHRILAHDCLLSGGQHCDVGETIEAARIRSLAIHAAAWQTPRGLYFFNLVPSSIDDPELDMRSTIEAVRRSGMQAGNVVFEVDEADLARDPVHAHSIRDYLGRNGFGFALSSAGVGAGAGSFHAVGDYTPDYINLDPRLVRDFDRPACAPAISKLVRMGEKSRVPVVAKGVDRVRMVENLWLLGVRFMQGHIFGDPAPHVE